MKTYTYLEESILKLFMAIHLDLSKPLKKTLSELIVCLLENNKAHISKMGENISTEGAGIMACIQRIRRFLSNKRISPSITVIPLIYLMRPLLQRLPEIVLIMDRTEWEKRLKYINILSVAVSYKGRALPLFWIVFGRKGCSSFEQWKRVLTPVIEGLRQMNWLFDKLIHVLGDREFGSPKLAEWLKCTYDIDSTLRIKSSIYLNSDYTPEIKVATLIENMVKGSRHILYNQTLTRDSSFKMNVLLTWKEEYDEPLVVATTSANPTIADKTYGKRVDIESMHKDWKTNAFDLEKTRVTNPKRIETLLIVIAFAYVLCVLEGDQKEMSGDVRKPPRGKTRMVGLFLNGLRTISRHLRRADIKKFKRFIFQLLLPIFNVWNIRPSAVL